MLQPASVTDVAGQSALSRWERRGLVALLFLFLLHCVHVERRSVFLKRRMTDLGVYLRAAWAVRSGADLYSITDENEFHYVYPPLFAILMTPFADPPPGVEQPHTVPFAVSVCLWYVFSVLCAFFAAHWLASVLEQKTGNREQGAGNSRNRFCCSLFPVPCSLSWRWWTLRSLPLVICLPPILATLVHGQVNLLLLALISGMIALSLRGRPWGAGLCLSGAICLKVFPAFLLLYPLWRRDVRCLAGCGLGLLLGLVVIPTAVWGPAGAWEQHRRFAEVVLLPGLGRGTDHTVAEELTNVTATDSQSLLAVIHNTLYPDRLTRPNQVSVGVRRMAYAVVGLMTLVLLLSAGRRKRSAGEEMFFFGALIINMLLLCPVCHLPYFCLLLPLAAALVERYWLPLRLGRLDRWAGLRYYGLLTLFVVNIVARTLPHVPGLQVLRDLGLSTYAALPLWLLAVASLWWDRKPASAGVQHDSEGAQRLVA
jgi:hypothetical protein